MKQIFSFFTLQLFLLSCGQITTEADAIKKNQAGIDLMNKGKYELALAAFKEAIQNPKLTLAPKGTIYRNIALCYQDIQNIDSSLHYFIIAAKIYRKNSYDYLVNMACGDLLIGKVEKAIAQLQSAASINPDNLSVNNTLGLIYLGDYGAEFTDFEKALIYNKKAFEISNSFITEDVLGRNYYKLKDYEMAEMHYENIRGQSPDELNYTLSMGMIKYKLKKTAEAEQLFKKVISMDSAYKENIRIFKENSR